MEIYVTKYAAQICYESEAVVCDFQYRYIHLLFDRIDMTSGKKVTPICVTFLERGKLSRLLIDLKQYFCVN